MTATCKRNPAGHWEIRDDELVGLLRSSTEVPYDAGSFYASRWRTALAQRCFSGVSYAAAASQSQAWTTRRRGRQRWQVVDSAAAVLTLTSMVSSGSPTRGMSRPVLATVIGLATHEPRPSR